MPIWKQAAFASKLLTSRQVRTVSLEFDYYERRLGTSGLRKEVDYRLPGNLIENTVKEKKPLKNIVTSKDCYRENLTKIPCDSKAPYQAGLLNTRAFLASHSGRFNLSRAGAMMDIFLCQSYPMSENIEKRVDKSLLIHEFRVQTKEDAIAQGVEDVFGNGSDCYTCHSQFAPHTQFFVKYKRDGLYIPTSPNIGKQQSGGDLGTGIDGLSASHYADPTQASSEAGAMLNTPAENLATAAKLMTNSPLYVQCLARNAIAHIFSLSTDEYGSIKKDFLEEVTQNMTADSSFQDLYLEIFSHPSIVNTISETF